MHRGAVLSRSRCVSRVCAAVCVAAAHVRAVSGGQFTHARLQPPHAAIKRITGTLRGTPASGDQRAQRFKTHSNPMGGRLLHEDQHGHAGGRLQKAISGGRLIGRRKEGASLKRMMTVIDS